MRQSLVYLRFLKKNTQVSTKYLNLQSFKTISRIGMKFYVQKVDNELQLYRESPTKRHESKRAYDLLEHGHIQNLFASTVDFVDDMMLIFLELREVELGDR